MRLERLEHQETHVCVLTHVKKHKKTRLERLEPQISRVCTLTRVKKT